MPPSVCTPTPTVWTAWAGAASWTVRPATTRSASAIRNRRARGTLIAALLQWVQRPGWVGDVPHRSARGRAPAAPGGQRTDASDRANRRILRVATGQPTSIDRLIDLEPTV